MHWGKLHFLTPEQLAERYPESERFIAIRRELDPEGVFLNDHLRPLFAWTVLGVAHARVERAVVGVLDAVRAQEVEVAAASAPGRCR